MRQRLDPRRFRRLELKLKCVTSNRLAYMVLAQSLKSNPRTVQGLSRTTYTIFSRTIITQSSIFYKQLQFTFDNITGNVVLSSINTETAD